MPTNKNASFRYRIIDQALRNTAKKWKIADLMNKISDELFEQFGIESGVCLRTVQYDLNVMKSDPPRGFSAPIICENGFYSYSDSEYSINNNPFNEVDIENLSEAAAILKQFAHLPVYSEISHILSKINQDADIGAYNYVDLETNEQYYNLGVLKNLYNLLKKKKVAIFEYKTFNNQEILSFTIHPYLLKEYRNRWFLIGWDIATNKHVTLAIDRIKSFRTTDTNGNLKHKKDLEDRLSQIIGISLPHKANPEYIRFYVSNESAMYVRTKPIHHTQQIVKKREKGLEFKIKVIPNYELYQVLLSYGEHLKILDPEHIQKHMADIIKKNYLNYFNTDI